MTNFLMRRCVPAVFIFILQSSAQAWYTPKSYRRDSTLEELRTSAAMGDGDAIFALGLRNDTGAIQILQTIARRSEYRTIEDRTSLTKSQRDYHRLSERIKSDKHRRVTYTAKAALMRMHAADYLKDFVIELSTTNAEWKATIIGDLGYAMDVRAIRYLGPLINDDTCGTGGQAHIVCVPIGVYAAAAIGKIVSTPFFDSNSPFSEFRLATSDRMNAKAWWQQNQEKSDDYFRSIQNPAVNVDSTTVAGVQIQSKETEPYSILIDSGSIPATVGAFKLVAPSTSIKMPTVDVLMIFDPKSGLLWWSYQLDKSNNVSDLIQNFMDSFKLFLANGNLYAFRSTGNNLMISESANRYKTQELAVSSIIPIVQQRIAVNNSAPVLPTQNVDLWKILGQSFFMVGSRVSSATLGSLSYTNKQWIIGMTGPNKDSAIVTLSGDYKVVSASLNGKAVYP